MHIPELSSIVIGDLGSFMLGLAFIGFSYFLMVALDVEASLSRQLPWFSLSLCAMGFALMSFLFVLEPSWLGANPLSWVWILTFMLAWAIGSSALGPLSLITVFSYYPLYLSQRSTDTRPHFERTFTDPYSSSIVAISLIAVLLIWVGLRVGDNLNKTLNSSWEKAYIFSLLTSTAISGILLSTVADVVIQAVKVCTT